MTRANVPVLCRPAVAPPFVAGRHRETYIHPSMIELSLLGPHVVAARMDVRSRRCPAQPKRFAPLAYMALGGGCYRGTDI